EQHGDVRMIERGEDARLALEARAPIEVRHERVVQDLERHLPSELRVFRTKDLAHPTRTQQREETVRSDGRARDECHEPRGLSVSKKSASGATFVFILFASQILLTRGSSRSNLPACIAHLSSPPRSRSPRWSRSNLVQPRSAVRIQSSARTSCPARPHRSGRSAVSIPAIRICRDSRPTSA